MSDHLSDRHRDELAASAIAPAIVDARGYQTITNPRALPVAFADLQRRPGLLIPIRNVIGDVATFQLKPDDPRVDATSGRPIKYETAKHGRPCLDVPAAVLPHLRTRDVTLWITEGCKKVDSALSHGIACVVGLLGVDAWTSEKTALTDWRELALKDRRVHIAFDSDVMRKASVRGALERLADHLAHVYGADVRYVVMPDLPDGSKCGLDDWFAAGRTMLDLEACTVDALPGSVMDWEPPQPLGPFFGPPCPLHALSPDHRAFVESVATSTQTPPDLAFWASIAAVGAATRGRYVVVPHKADWREPCHIQSLQVIASGGGKSPVYRHVISPIEAVETSWYEEWQGAHELWDLQDKRLQSQENKARRDAEKASATETAAYSLEEIQKARIEHARNEPILKRIIADDATAQALWYVMDRQAGAIAVMSPEGGFLANITGQYSDAPIFDPVLKGYSGESHTLDRKTEREFRRIARANLAISLAVQPVVLMNMGDVPGFDHMGVSGRFLYTLPQPIAWPDLDVPAPPDDVTDWWTDTVTRIATDTTGSAYSPRALNLSEGAIRAFQDERAWWRDARARGLFADMKEWGEKYPGKVLRIAGLLHILEADAPVRQPIPQHLMTNAIAIMRHAIEHARLAHGVMYGAGGHEQASEVLEAVRRLESPVSRTALNQRLRHRTAFQKATMLEAPLQLLEEYRWIKRERHEAEQRGKHPGGRPTETIYLNPLVSPETTLTTLATPPDAPPTAVVGVVRGYFEERTFSHRAPIRPEPLAPTGTDGAGEDDWEVF